ncbi:unnamed protein product [Cylicocyclus nassatus]|uniref:7TM GPCR serpentine receptor class x (Srx) domain-containing protein n=1 Tax=Cylicocyclus nassatus TaxID=53992 RepID=A0AA36HC39_CYLNA|nr:unnamed protein product [Cylicocyclus nassatus]
MTGLLNFATILAVRRTTKAAKSMSGELHAKRLMELNLLKQAIAQAAAFATQILCVAFLVAVFNSKWTVLIIITFNKGFRKLIRKPAKPPSTAFQSAAFHTRHTTTF